MRLNRLLASRSERASAEPSANAIADRAERGEPVAHVAPSSSADPGLGAGQPIDPSIRGTFGSTFGRLLDRVRVHDGDAADRATRSIGARAFAYGSHLVFGRGEYRPHSSEGRRTIAHEIGHVATGDSATAVHANGPRDHHHDAVRMQTAELTTELETMVGRLADTTGAEHDELRARVDAFRTELNRRSAPRDVLRELIARQREQITTEEPSAIMQLLRARVGAEGVFYAGIYAGFQYEFPPGLAVDGARELLEHPLEYGGGYVVGLLQGIWHGFVNLLEGLWTLVRIGFEMSIAGQAISFLSDPSGYIAARRRELALARRVGAALRQFGDELRADPTVLVQYGADLGFAVGQEFANMYRELVTQSAYEQGRRIGDVVGQIVFEILLEILLAIATEGIGNLLRGVAATGQAVRAGGRLARALRAVVEASPALRNLLRALTGAEDLRIVGRGTEVVSDLAGAERRVAGAGERGAEVLSHGDDVLRHADDAPRPSAGPHEAPHPVEGPVPESVTAAADEVPASAVPRPDAPGPGPGLVRYDAQFAAEQAGHPIRDPRTPRRSWQEFEAAVDDMFPGGERQPSFRDGRPIRYGAEGSVRPDMRPIRGLNHFIESKAYDLANAGERAALYRTLGRQARARALNLPPGSVQHVFLDARGFAFPREYLTRIPRNIEDVTGGLIRATDVIFVY